MHKNNNFSSEMITGFRSVVLIGIFALRCNLSNSQTYSRVNGRTLNYFKNCTCIFCRDSSITISNFL